MTIAYGEATGKFFLLLFMTIEKTPNTGTTTVDKIYNA